MDLRQRVLDKLRLGDGCIEHSPSIRMIDATIAEIGKCEDCRWWKKPNRYGICNLHNIGKVAEGYCDKFERKSNE